MDTKRCSVCNEEKAISEFRNENKSCNMCRDKANEQKKKYRINNPEKVALQAKKRLDRVRDEVITCPICQYDVKKYKFKQHENSVGHQYLLDMYEAGEEVDKPDEIETDRQGRVWYKCSACKETMLQCMWGSHIASPNHNDCKEEAMTISFNRDILETQHLLTYDYNCCDE